MGGGCQGRPERLAPSPLLNAPYHAPMQILLTNDDGIYAPGLAAMHRALEPLGEVTVVAPATEQSGVGHSITFLTPLMAKKVYEQTPGGAERFRGWAIEGSPADCVKLAIAQLQDGPRLCPAPPDLVVSGVNGGLNTGINVLYSGTVAAATEAAAYGLRAIAVSLEYNDHARFDRAAQIAVGVIRQMLKRNAWEDHLLYNLNIPTAATQENPANHGVAHPAAPGLHPGPPVRVATMSTARWPAEFEERRDPNGRRYFWASGSPAEEPPGADTDRFGIEAGHVTLTPLIIDRTRHELLPRMRAWDLRVPND